jgi:CDP-diacylglycerol--glycerol-3-phosphate 3-phosphatidyltransferase
MTLYDFKPDFQRQLRPAARRLAAVGITANQVTIATAALSIVIGVGVAANAHARALFLLIPLWCAVRMALNAIDGLLAKEFCRKTALGAYLNELGDVVSDAALYLPFAFVSPFSVWAVGLVAFLSFLCELAGVLAPMVGSERRYDGPMGKSDRAALFGVVGLWVGVGFPLPLAAAWIMPAAAALIGVTVLNRVSAGIRAARVSDTRAEHCYGVTPKGRGS